MAIKSETRVLGVRETVANLRNIEERLRQRIVRDAARAAAEVLARKIAATTYGPGRQRRTGLMLESQGVRTHTTSETVYASIYMRAIDAKGMVNGRPRLRAYMPKATAAFYWWFLERGTKQRTTYLRARPAGKARLRIVGKGGNRGHITPRPWVGPAFEAEADHALEAFRLVLARDVEAYANTLPKTTKRGV